MELTDFKSGRDLSQLNHFIDLYRFQMLTVAQVHLDLHPRAWSTEICDTKEIPVSGIPGNSAEIADLNCYNTVYDLQYN